MTTFRHNRAFFALMFLAFITAFFVPNRISDRVRAPFQALFVPVAAPTRWIAGVMHHRLWPDRGRDDAAPGQPRPAAEIYTENDSLRVELASVRGQLEHFRALAGERELLGQVRELCTSYTVVAGDPGPRDALAIVGKSAGAIRPGAAALTSAGIVGRVERSGVAAAQVLLLTDKQSVFTGSFGRYTADAEGKTQFHLHSLSPTLVRGLGRGQMVADKLPWKDAIDSGLKENDWCILDDPAWSPELKWYRTGRVASVKQSRQNLLFAEVLIEPVVNARQLRDLMVMEK